MTYQEIEQEWINNGGNPIMAPIMAAIAMAESSGNPFNTTGDNGTSYGLYQIHYTVHPQFDPNQLTNAGYNTNAAIMLSGNGKDLTPWTTYNTGAYKQYLAAAYRAVGLPVPANLPQSQSDGTQTQETGFHLAPSNQWCMNPFSLKCWAPMFNQQGAPNLIEQIVSEGTVALGAIALFVIGGLWIILGNNNTRKIFVQTAKDALV